MAEENTLIVVANQTYILSITAMKCARCWARFASKIGLKNSPAKPPSELWGKLKATGIYLDRTGSHLLSMVLGEV